MKLWGLICCVIFAFTNGVNAQASQADSIPVAKSYMPAKRVAIEESAGSLAMYFQSLYKNKTEQLRAAYNWVTTHILYNSDSSYYFNNVDNDTKVAATLRRRKGVCENYAVLFAELAKKMDIQAFVVHGYAPSAVSGKNAAHSWVAISLSNDWYLCDPTWDAGMPARENYFLGTPAQFISSHMPFDPIWQLLEKPVGYKKKKDEERFNYKDSIANFLKADSLQQFIAIERRMKQMDTNKELFRIWQSYYRMQIVIIDEETNMNLYNSAVADLNKATLLFNEFVQYRNNQFMPLKPDKELSQMLDPIGVFIGEAKNKINQIGAIAENFQYNTESLQLKLDNLLKRSDEQKFFLKKYLASAIADREKLMYK